MKNVLAILYMRERSVSWLARKIGVSPSLIVLWAQGKRRITKKDEIAEVLQVPRHILFQEVEL
jgi:transcriptional regulator with XRE-family HTH domain